MTRRIRRCVVRIICTYSLVIVHALVTQYLNVKSSSEKYVYTHTLTTYKNVIIYTATDMCACYIYTLDFGNS